MVTEPNLGGACAVRVQDVRGAKVLLADGNSQFRRVMWKALTSEQYQVALARNGEEALEALRRDRHDLVLLDLEIPGMSGMEACRAIRALSGVGLIALSARGLERDKVGALDAGADDYVTKPFSLQELLARVRATLRRAPVDARTEIVRCGPIVIDAATHRVTVHGNLVRLTRKEFNVLNYLAAHANTTIPHRTLLQAVWGPEYGSEIFNLRVIINQVRYKIEPEPHRPRYLLTAAGVGYLFRNPANGPC